MSHFLRNLALASIILSGAVSSADTSVVSELPVCTADVKVDRFSVTYTIKIGNQVYNIYESAEEAAIAVTELLRDGKCRSEEPAK
jgi:hypothetical protein